MHFVIRITVFPVRFAIPVNRIDNVILTLVFCSFKFINNFLDSGVLHANSFFILPIQIYRCFVTLVIIVINSSRFVWARFVSLMVADSFKKRRTVVVVLLLTVARLLDEHFATKLLQIILFGRCRFLPFIELVLVS